MAPIHGFIHPGPRTGSLSRVEGMLLSWAVVYPLITLLLAVGGPALAALPLALRTLAITALLVPAMALVMPRATRLAARREHPDAGPPEHNARGTR